jgi:predicted DNA-binding protein
MKPKSFSLNQSLVARLKWVSMALDKTQTEIVTEALEAYLQTLTADKSISELVNLVVDKEVAPK